MKILFFLYYFIFIKICLCSLIDDYPICSLDDIEGTKCLIHVNQIRPTQYSIGSIQVRSNKGYAKSLYEVGDLDSYKSYYEIPIIIGLNQFFLADKHHHVAGLAFWMTLDSSEKYFTAEIWGNRQSIPEEDFWKTCVENGEVWLYDIKGVGPMDPKFLPSSFLEMFVDPYRDIARLIRTEGYFESVSVLYQEFYWALFFRINIPYPHKKFKTKEEEMWCELRPYDTICTEEGFSMDTWINSDDVLNRARYLSKHKFAKDLPGFTQ